MVCWIEARVAETFSLDTISQLSGERTINGAMAGRRWRAVEEDDRKRVRKGSGCREKEISYIRNPNGRQRGSQPMQSVRQTKWRSELVRWYDKKPLRTGGVVIGLKGNKCTGKPFIPQQSRLTEIDHGHCVSTTSRRDCKRLSWVEGRHQMRAIHNRAGELG